MEEHKDYFLIYDACRTELEKESPEGTLTCIGFRPMEAEEIWEEISIIPLRDIFALIVEKR